MCYFCLQCLFKWTVQIRNISDQLTQLGVGVVHYSPQLTNVAEVGDTTRNWCEEQAREASSKTKELLPELSCGKDTSASSDTFRFEGHEQISVCSMRH